VLEVVFDTNVIVSGLTTRSGHPCEALEAWRSSDVVLVISRPIVDEVVEVLRRPFFGDRRHIGEADVARVKRALETAVVLVSRKKCLRVIKGDPDGDRELECVLEGGADYVDSGDHRLLELESYRGIRILTP